MQQLSQRDPASSTMTVQKSSKDWKWTKNCCLILMIKWSNSLWSASYRQFLLWEPTTLWEATYSWFLLTKAMILTRIWIKFRASISQKVQGLMQTATWLWICREETTKSLISQRPQYLEPNKIPPWRKTPSNQDSTWLRSSLKKSNLNWTKDKANAKNQDKPNQLISSHKIS